jgi:flagellar biosynthetic protein FliR
MDAILDQISSLASRDFVKLANWHFYAFLLIVIRIGGLMTAGPLFSQSSIPVNVRVILALGLGFIITPVVLQTSSQNLIAYDANHDGLVSLDEVPVQLQGRVQHLAESRHLDPDRGIPFAAFRSQVAVPARLSGLLVDVLSEFSLGFLLGLGVTILMSGLQLAGQIIDRQIGLEFGSIINPDLQGGASITGQMFFLLGGASLLLLEPINGHLLMLQAIVETFDAMPVGEAVLFQGTHELLTELIQKSLLLGVQVAAPVMAAMSLVSVSMGFLGHSVPQINQLVVGFPIRSLAGILILSLSLSGVGRVLVDAVPDVITTLQLALTSWQ